MDDNFSLSYHHYNDIQEWMSANPEKRDADLAAKKKIAVAKQLRDSIRIDHYLGERVHVSIPMQVHIISGTDSSRSMPRDVYKCLNVTFTNHGVYIIDDRE